MNQIIEFINIIKQMKTLLLNENPIIDRVNNYK